MYILIDKDQMCAVYKHQESKVLSNLMHIELPHCVSSIIDEESFDSFKNFSDLELRLLYENLCGQKCTNYHDRELLLNNITILCKSIEESRLNVLEVEAQYEHISNDDPGFYKYISGKKIPNKLIEPFNHSGLKAAPGFVPITTPTQAQITAPNPVKQAANWFAPPKQQAKPNPNLESPKSGSKTGRVWIIADEIWNKNNKPNDYKAIRKQIIEACESESINSSTASVQFSKWRNSKL